MESTLEGRFELTVNRAKTRLVNMRGLGASVNFLGFTFRYDRNATWRRPDGRVVYRRAASHERARRYLNVFPSTQAQARIRARIRELTDTRRCFEPIPRVIHEVNQVLSGWGRYFSVGHPRAAFRKVNWYVTNSLVRHLRRRSQRPFRPPKGVSFPQQLARLGLRLL